MLMRPRGPNDMPTVDRNVADLLDELKVLVKFCQERQLSMLDSVLAKKLYRFDKGCAWSFTGEDVLCLFHEGFTESALWGQVDDLLVGSLSTILTTCSASRGKMQGEISASGASWRYNMDRFFFDFLSTVISSILQSEMDGQDNTKGQRKVHAVLGHIIALPRSVYGGYDLNDLDPIEQEAEEFVNTIDIRCADGNDLNEDEKSIERKLHHSLLCLVDCRWQVSLTPVRIMKRMAISSTQARCGAVGVLRMPVCLAKEILSPYCFIRPRDENNDLAALEGRQSTAVLSLSPFSLDPNIANYNPLDSSTCDSSAVYKDFQEAVQMSTATDRVEAIGQLLVDDLPRTTSRSRCQHNEPEMTYLDLLLILIEYKGLAMNHIQSQNQRCLHCTSAARFMEAIGIIEFPIFSVLLDGPLAVLATTWVKDGHMASFDVSNALGAWHYATVMVRIVVFWGTALANRFEQVKDRFVEGVKKDNPRLRWTQAHQALHHALRDAPVEIAPDNEP
ncbi:predicted protein [Postia placenta Mad-698-R]|uniref:Uncharacterized protein n=1 Tax=Postia placenta MAD-698-R-SB12 TaxID=670580 RepID=A0A1X6MPQ3_9APHY|nr:hypothetical protein POSPLADRAFT_1049595 [Postia placenta MAD-698-R-SB12]EED77270.1 predicted protein [Postia placenta Mad-698-R]OSX58397.1 hypothetical protein POSPLADRAFT_1049595 [Postia placenta MAD-698-R-SB12]